MRTSIFPEGSLVSAPKYSFECIFAPIALVVLMLYFSHIFEYTPYKVFITILDENVFFHSNVIPLILIYVDSLSFVMASFA